MDFAIVFKKLGEFFMYFCSKEFTFAGYTTSVGSVFVWCGVALIGIMIMKGLSD